MIFNRPTSRTTIALIAAAAVLAAPTTALAVPGAPAAQASRGGPPGTTATGGAPIGGLVPQPKPKHRLPSPPPRLAHGSWLSGFTITEYWPAPEAWFRGRFVVTPGLTGKHRVDWLYSATGVSMEGDGVGLDGKRYHIDSLGDGGWVTRDGFGTSPSDGWSGGPPYWRAGHYWTNRSGGVTFPLGGGGWSRGKGLWYTPLPNVSFASGPSTPLHFYQSIAVDPSVIPLGSRVYIPAYKHDGHGGWFLAQDTGGAINGNHVDVYRTPPASPNDGGQSLEGKSLYVIRAQG